MNRFHKNILLLLLRNQNHFPAIFSISKVTSQIFFNILYRLDTKLRIDEVCLDINLVIQNIIRSFIPLKQYFRLIAVLKSVACTAFIVIAFLVILRISVIVVGVFPNFPLRCWFLDKEVCQLKTFRETTKFFSMCSCIIISERHF